MVEKVFGYV